MALAANRSVWELQVILNTLGAPIVIDKTFGPITQRTWSLLASNLGLDPRFEKLDALNASVNDTTYKVLLDQYIQRKAPKPVGSNDFERLNNAIVRMPSRMPGSKAAAQLAERWAGSEKNWWRTAQELFLEPAFTTFWEEYVKVWQTGTTEQKTKMEHPVSVKPGNAWQTFQALWTPALEAARAAGAAAVQKARDILREAGAEMGRGAADAAEKKAYDWVWGVGGLALGAAAVYYLLQRQQRT